MPAFFKKLFTIAVIVTLGYLIFGYHYIIIDKSVHMLKKSKLTLNYTFFSTEGKTAKNILSIPVLWKDGIGELLVKEGMISEEKLEMYREKKEAKEDDDN